MPVASCARMRSVPTSIDSATSRYASATSWPSAGWVSRTRSNCERAEDERRVDDRLEAAEQIEEIEFAPGDIAGIGRARAHRSAIT